MATKLCFPAICHRLNTFWEQRNTQHAVQATIATKKKSEVQFVWAGQHLPGHTTQRKPIASQVILLQASDWTFLYDLDGQLQFPIDMLQRLWGQIWCYFLPQARQVSSWSWQFLWRTKSTLLMTEKYWNTVP